MTPVAGHVDEAERQRVLLAALFSGSSGGDSGDSALAAAGCVELTDRLQRGLVAYRSNAASIAERALAAAYPTLSALVGADGTSALARGLWLAEPPRRGDLAQWGHGLPAFIESRREFDPWPYLADCARLDAAVQRCESAADATLDPHSLSLLATQPPESLSLRLLPCVQLLRSAWPVAALRAAHEEGFDTADQARRVAAALASGQAESVLVARAGWRAVTIVCDAPCFAWMQALHDHLPLATALQRAGDAFDFDAWLLQALRHGWLWKAELHVQPIRSNEEKTP